MKKAWIIAFIILSNAGVSFSSENGTSSFGGILDRVKRYCSEANTSNSAQCLEAYLAYRCTVNFAWSDPFYIPDCISATTDLVSELDLTQVEVNEIRNKNSDPLQLKQVAFTKKLKETFLKNWSVFSDQVETYLEDFERSYRFNESNSLWNRTLQIAGSDRERALESMVTLFQDFASPGYLQFLDSTAEKMKNQNHRTTLLGNTEKFADFYIPLIENRIKKNNNPQYSIYPGIVFSQEMTPLAHHFYTPAYLASRLKKKGYATQVSFYAAFLFNTAYEFIKLDKKMKTKRWPLQDPLPFSAKKYELQARKIYTGYLGALFGLGKSSRALDYATFSSALGKDPSGFVSNIHHDHL